MASSTLLGARALGAAVRSSLSISAIQHVLKLAPATAFHDVRLGLPAFGESGRPFSARAAAGSSDISSGLDSLRLTSAKNKRQAANGSSHCYKHAMTLDDLETIRLHGLQGLPDFHVWGNQRLAERWNAAAAALPAAVARLAAISRGGPELVVCVDLETTGISKTSCIVELAAMVAPDKTNSFVSLGRPLQRIQFGAQQTHGISWQDVKGAPLLPELKLEFVTWLTEQCQAAPGGSSTLTLIDHNLLAFDLPILAHWAHALDLPELVALLGGLPGTSKAAGAWLVEDTLRMARSLKHQQRFESCKLVHLAKHFGIAHKNAHRALSDVEATSDLYFKLRALLRC